MTMYDLSTFHWNHVFGITWIAWRSKCNPFNRNQFCLYTSMDCLFWIRSSGMFKGEACVEGAKEICQNASSKKKTSKKTTHRGAAPHHIPDPFIAYSIAILLDEVTWVVGVDRGALLPSIHTWELFIELLIICCWQKLWDNLKRWHLCFGWLGWTISNRLAFERADLFEPSRCCWPFILFSQADSQNLLILLRFSTYYFSQEIEKVLLQTTQWKKKHHRSKMTRRATDDGRW